jgi:hypothetical protein
MTHPSIEIFTQSTRRQLLFLLDVTLPALSDDDTFSKLIGVICAHSGLTQKELAKRLGLYQPIISRWKTEMLLPHPSERVSIMLSIIDAIKGG